MKTRFLLLCLCLLPTLIRAQGVVNVNNRGLNPPRLVLGPDGSPLVGTNYVAQIVYGATPDTVTNELGAVMPFRVPGTSSPGTWNPGPQSYRILNGFTTGQTVWMQVFVWRIGGFTNWEHLRTEVPYLIIPGTGYVSTHGRPDGPETAGGYSYRFRYVVGDGSDSDPTSTGLRISEFEGFNVYPIYPPLRPQILNVEENGFLKISNSVADVLYPWTLRFAVLERGQTETLVRPNPGSLGRVIYGEWARCLRSSSSLCFDGWRPQLVAVEVTPSPRRPFLDFALTNSRPSLTLRGLPPRSYRIEGSTNLNGWTRLGELSAGEDGNAPVPDAWLATNATQFVRFVPLPQ